MTYRCVMSHRGERLSRTFHNPNFDLDEDQENNEMLVGDIRRVMRIALAVVVTFSIVLMVGAGPESGANLLLIVAVPLVIILTLGELLGVWIRRSRRS